MISARWKKKTRSTRVRGGAVPRSQRAAGGQQYEERARINADAKELIARWATNMVEDGDTIILDASTTVLSMVDFLKTGAN